MTKSEAAFVGGKIKRQKALEKYYINPSVCKYCNKIIEPKEGQNLGEVRIKQFCNHTCSASYNNVNRARKAKPSKPALPKVKFDRLQQKTKGEIFKIRKNWQSARTEIRRHAVHIYSTHNTGSCINCGYSKHIEICHIKAVSEFEDSTLVTQINDVNNLIGLCPNCHWELDNNIITIEEIKQNFLVRTEQ